MARGSTWYLVHTGVLAGADRGRFLFQLGGGRKRLLQYEEYSWTGKAGFRYTF